MIRVIPAVVYDFLEFSSLVYGGIGASASFSYVDETPMCVFGHVWSLPNDIAARIGKSMQKVHLTPATNDMAVWTINERRNRRRKNLNSRAGRFNLNDNSRVSFKSWCKELNVERGK